MLEDRIKAGRLLIHKHHTWFLIAVACSRETNAARGVRAVVDRILTHALTQEQLEAGAAPK